MSIPTNPERQTPTEHYTSEVDFVRRSGLFHESRDPALEPTPQLKPAEPDDDSWPPRPYAHSL